MLVCIDGDELLYRACSSVETLVDWGDGHGPGNVGTMDGVTRMLESEIETAQRRLMATDVIVCLSSATNYRKDLWQGYKNNRKLDKPGFYFEARKWFQENYECDEEWGIEADDVIGLYGEGAIASSDKDMNTLPGRPRYSFYHREVYDPVLEIEADRFLFEQSLMGDSSDGYKGCPGIGTIKAKRLLAGADTVGDMEEIVIHAFEKAGLTDDDALLQIRLARILRPGEFDEQRMKPILYTWSFDG